MEKFLDAEGFSNFLGSDIKRFQNKIFCLTLKDGRKFIAKYLDTDRIVYECCGHILAKDFFDLKTPTLYVMGEKELWVRYVQPYFDMAQDEILITLEQMESSYRSKYLLFSLIAGIWDIHGKNLIADRKGKKPYVIDFELIRPNSTYVHNNELYHYFWDLESAHQENDYFYKTDDQFITHNGIIWKMVDYYSLKDIKKYINPTDLADIKLNLTKENLRAAWQPILQKFSYKKEIIEATIEGLMMRLNWIS